DPIDDIVRSTQHVFSIREELLTVNQCELLHRPLRAQHHLAAAGELGLPIDEPLSGPKRRPHPLTPDTYFERIFRRPISPALQDPAFTRHLDDMKAAEGGL